MIYFKPKTNRFTDILTKDPRATRFDIIGRAVISALQYGYEILKDRACIIYIDSDKKATLIVNSSNLRIKVSDSDEDVVNSLRFLLRSGEYVLYGIDYQEVLRVIHNTNYKIYYLHERGLRLKNLKKGKVLFVLGSNVDAPRPQVDHEYVSIGPLPYQVNHVITYINWLYHSIVPY